MTGRAATVGHVTGRMLRTGICLGVSTCLGFAATSTVGLAAVAALILSATAAWGETLTEALVKAYQTNPQLNAERARQRGTDENVPLALAGYRPQIIASLSAGL